ncbi:ABC transporter G family member 15 [Morus notabilis]|uniref:ABC transporter G family member 15 n=1 Tax=Morus notabilis TaxID=981085 RepID=W9SFD1_9ROSA|nr:ABC transporter G family member 15 [Morus notabilis]
MERKENSGGGPSLIWENITVVAAENKKSIGKAESSSRKLLNEISGYAEPNRIMALMGPSGTGKSTLLDAFAGKCHGNLISHSILTGRLSANVRMAGDVIVKGKKLGTGNCGGISYLNQEDVFLGTLTVRETITYSANLRISYKMSNEEIKELVEKTITQMGLEHCADNKIGNWHLRGISNGEKRRLSLSLEILSQPHIMLLDEPTTGLDSASAFFVIWALTNIAREGRIVICSIHQPSGYLFDLFDDLCLLSSGEAVYFGEAKLAVKGTTTSHSPVNLTMKDIRAILIQKYKSSVYATLARNKIEQIKFTEEEIRLSKKSNASWLKQVYTLTDRSFVNMKRDVSYYWIRILFYLGVGVTTGSIYFEIDTSYVAIIARAKCQAFVYGFMLCASIGGLPSIIEELKVCNRERFNKHYGATVVVISNFLSSLPFLVAMALFSGTIIYEMVKLRPGFSHYFYFCINLFCCISITECCMMVVAYLVPNVLMGIGIGISLIVFMMMASEIFRPLSDLPKFFWRYPMSYISFASWALQGVYKNDVIGLEFDPLVPGDPKLKGEMVLETMYGIPLDHSKWWDLAALICLLIFHRLLFFLVLKYKEKISLWFKYKYYSNTTLQQVFRRYLHH